jgi:hypothetical protein
MLVVVVETSRMWMMNESTRIEFDLHAYLH